MKLRTTLLAAVVVFGVATHAPEAIAKTKGPPPAATPSTTEVSDPATGALGIPPEGKGQIVFFRPSKWGGGGVAFTAKENGEGKFKLGNGSYAILVVDPGQHTYEIKSETTDSFTIEVDAGETYYVQETLTSGLVLWRPRLNISDEQTFRSMVAKLRVSTWRPSEKETDEGAAQADAPAAEPVADEAAAQPVAD